MAKKPTCFVICPIGDAGSETRENADDLLQMIIEPALEIFDFRVSRGDHRNDSGQIDVDVIRSVQEADLCICDLSDPNPNVYYELGRRDETGKPIILVKRMGTADLPVDIATRRYIEYDLDSRHGPRDSQKKLRENVEPLVENGFESANSITLSDLDAALKRIERKVDRISTSGGTGNGGNTGGSGNGGSGMTPSEAKEKLYIALRQRDIRTAEQCMDVLELSMDRYKWLDTVVETTAGIGSLRAGRILLENAEDFLDCSMSYHKKMEYLGVMTSFISRQDMEQEYQSLVERFSFTLQQNDDDEEDSDRISVRNQVQRLYYGIYFADHNPDWLEKCIAILQSCLRIGQRDFLYYNLAGVTEKLAEGGPDNLRMDRLYDAKEYIDRCLELTTDEDADHIEAACRLYYKLSLPELDDMLERLENADATKATKFRIKMDRGEL